MPFNAPGTQAFPASPAPWATHPSLSKAHRDKPTPSSSTPPFKSAVFLQSLRFYSTENCPDNKAAIFTSEDSFAYYYDKTVAANGTVSYTPQAIFAKREEDARAVKYPDRVVFLNRRFTPDEIHRLCLRENFTQRLAVLTYATAGTIYSQPCDCCAGEKYPRRPFPHCVPPHDVFHLLDQRCLNCRFLDVNCTWSRQGPLSRPESAPGIVSKRHVSDPHLSLSRVHPGDHGLSLAACRREYRVQYRHWPSPG
jgi:hypothetical protein